MGDSLAAILEECRENDKVPPKPILDHLDKRESWMDFYLGCYNELGGDRGSGNRVTWLAMDRYCERFEFDPDFAVWFMRCIRAIDGAHIEVWKSQEKADQAAAEARARRGIRR